MRCLTIMLSLSLVVKISSQKCPSGWHQSEVVPKKCYYVGIQKKTWFDAEASCQNAQTNGHLTSITSAFENGNVDAVVISTPSASDCGQFWTGGNDVTQNGNFTWKDGSTWEYHNWATGQPDLTQQYVSSAPLKPGGQWKTESSGLKNCFICDMFIGGGTSLPPTTPSSTPMTDCKDWFNQGARTDGIYSINPAGMGPFNVFCDMTTDGGGWTIFQRRIDGTLPFFGKLWNDYKVGFNNGLENNLWLGNDNIHVLTTKDSNVELRIDIFGDRNPASSNPNIYLWEKHTNFYIDDEAHFYRLHLSPPNTGNATLTPGNGFYFSNGFNFSTADSTHGANNPHCSTITQFSGWWMTDCAATGLNGKYVPEGWPWGNYFAFFWGTGTYYINPVKSLMMLRSLA